MTSTSDDIADATRQFWNLVGAIRERERADGTDPVLADLYEDAEYLQLNGVTAHIRERCGRMVADWHGRDGGGGLRAPGRADDREPA